MTVPITFEVNEDLCTERGHRRIMNQLLREEMEHHRDARIPKHFDGSPETTAGVGGYGYKARSRKYQRQKLKKFGHNTPLVYSGRLRDSIRQSSKITATANRCSWKARSYFPLKPERRAEIEAVSNRERIEIAKSVEKKYAEQAARPENRRQRRRRSK
jgi:hypothetical protein